MSELTRDPSTIDEDTAKAAKIAAVKARKAAASVPNLLKELNVKIAVVKRMDKEVKFYIKEAAENEAVVQRLKDEGKDAYDMKQAIEVKEESYMMIPDSKNRFQKSLEDLLGFLDENSNDSAISGTEQLQEAKALLSSNGIEFDPEEGGTGDDDTGAEFQEGEVF